MRASGSVGLSIGTTAPSSLLHISSATGPILTLSKTNATAKNWYVSNNWASTNAFSISDDSNYRMAIDTSGNVGIGTSVPAYLLDVVGAGGVRISGSNSAGFMEFIDNTAGGTTSNGLQIRAGSNSSTGAVMAYFIRPDSTAIGSITQNSTTTVAYNTTSDRRIKENITDSASGLDLLARIRVRDYNYIADPANQIRQGFVAQELYEVYPQAVTVGCVERIRKRIHGRSTTASSRRCWLSLCRASRVGLPALSFAQDQVTTLKY